jgi:sodium-independent sulfate anion transporter 11
MLDIVQWLPRYSPSWILRDILAGLTIGILLVPQSLAYTKVANTVSYPLSYQLRSTFSWEPQRVIFTV